MISYEAKNYSQDETLVQPDHLSVIKGKEWAAIKLENRQTRQALYRYVAGSDSNEAIAELAGISTLIKTKIGHASFKYALVPREIFHRDDARDLAASHFFLEKKDQLLSDHIYQSGIENIYCPLTSTVDVEVADYHALSSLLSFLPMQKDRIYLIQSHHNTVVIGVKNNQVVYAKMVSTESEDEVLYHVVKGYDVSQLHPHRHALAVGGRILPDSDMYRLLYRFIKDISWLRVPEIRDENSHLFYDVHLLSRYF